MEEKTLNQEVNVLLDYQGKHGFPMHITISESEVQLGPFHIALCDIKEIVFHPIEESLQGLGGWIKFKTEDNPHVPELDNKNCWKVLLNNEYAFGSDIIRGNVFYFGCAYKGSYNYKEEDGLEKTNEKMREIVSLVNRLISNS